MIVIIIIIIIITLLLIRPSNVCLSRSNGNKYKFAQFLKLSFLNYLPIVNISANILGSPIVI